MHEDPPPRVLTERTGKHLCVSCLALVPAEEYFRNDHICDACAAKDPYAPGSMPEPKAPAPKKR
ncbi:MAG: hypothetical protein M3Q69_03120 [Acidobacteriota bacterium]|nr:hypothetical protein [Acidobacteriota bacterium]